MHLQSTQKNQYMACFANPPNDDGKTHSSGENDTRQVCVLWCSCQAHARLVMQTSRQLIYKWSIWEYDTALGKKREKRVAVRVNFPDMVLFIEQTGLQSGES